MGTKKLFYFLDRVRDGVYVRAWKEGRGRSQEIIVQVWKSGKMEGPPDGDWAMPGILGETLAVDQAILQTT